MNAMFIVATSILSIATTFVPVRTCQFGNRLLENASNNQVRLESGEVIGFKHDALLSMCFYHRSMQQCGEDIARFTSCSLPCRQHSNIVITVESEVLVNVRMLAPDDTYDKAYVIRVENETVIYFVEGPFCTVEKHLHTLKPPMLLLQIPANNGCVTTTGSLLPTPETQATPSINLGLSQKQENIAALTLGILLFIVCLIASFILFGAGYLCYKNRHRHTVVAPSKSQRV